MSEPTAAEAPPPPPRKSRKLLYIVLGLVVVLAGAGVAAWMLLKPKAAGEHAQAKAAPAEPIYVALDPPFVVNFESGGLVRFLQVTVQAMTTDPATAELIKRHDPMVRNALLMLLSGQSYDTLKSGEGKERLRTAALEEVRKVIAGQGGKAADVKNLYFTSFVMQ